MPTRVHLTHPPEDLAQLTTLLDDHISLSTGPELPPTGAEVIVSGRPDEAMVAQANAVIVPWAGIPENTLELVRAQPNVTLHNLHHNAPQVAELAVALLFAVTKYILPYDSGLRRGDWTMRYHPTQATLLSGKTALILGYGAIGRHAGRILRATGMHVVGVNRSGKPSTDPGADRINPISNFQNLLPEADALIVALPLTEETRGLIGRAEIDALPPGAFLVNIGRGPIIEQDALYTALKNGRLGGAGLDVWWNYPVDEETRTSTYPADAPLHELDNVVMSPHRAGSVKERNAGWSAALADLLNVYARKGSMPNQVNLDLGY